VTALRGVLLGGAAIAVVVYARTMTRPGHVPQIDDPLRRGTDLPSWSPAPPAAPTAARRAAVYGGRPLDDDLAALGGAVLGLAYATDDTTARYWLSQAARRGATQEQLTDLWAEWERLNVPTYLRTDREDPYA
jgi:hypothetical protein